MQKKPIFISRVEFFWKIHTSFHLVRSPLFTSIQRPFTILYPWQTTTCLNIFSSFMPSSVIAHTESALPSYFFLVNAPADLHAIRHRSELSSTPRDIGTQLSDMLDHPYYPTETDLVLYVYKGTSPPQLASCTHWPKSSSLRSALIGSLLFQLHLAVVPKVLV